jgi:hemoglobin-like flavoprotein
MPARVFVSYSRRDVEWRQRFQDAMGGGFYNKKFELWFDEKIQGNEEWESKIQRTRINAGVALLLVGNGFLNSGYIAKKELPKILDHWEANQVKILWVPIHAIDNAILEITGLDKIQSAWPRGSPLSDLKGKKLDDALMHIATSLVNAIGLDDGSDEIRPKVLERIPEGTVLGESFAAGDYSMFYRAKQFDVDVAVKALVPTPNKAWLSADFIKRANTVRKITNSTAIEIRHVIADARLPCVVMGYLNIPTLKSRLEKEGKLSGQLVANAIGQLARLSADLHLMDGEPLIGPVRPSHVHYDADKNKAFISLLPIANETLESCRNAPTRLQDAEALTYLSPERYYGKPIGERTDQYYLALLALELLHGKPPISVETFADLKSKEEFFVSPRSYFDETLRRSQPALSFVLTKMLEPEPENRWAAIGDLVAALQDIAKGKVPEVVTQHADAQYTTVLRKNAAFFRSFYRILFEKSDAIAVLFQRASIEEQSRKLDKAMSNILNFTQSLRTSSLADAVDSHRGMGIEPEHFGMFRDAFIEALREAGITDGYSQDAWRAILDPALNYMRDQIGSPAS